MGRGARFLKTNEPDESDFDPDAPEDAPDPGADLPVEGASGPDDPSSRQPPATHQRSA